jgi:DNA (cytosine-5)-methyltransferase 1
MKFLEFFAGGGMVRAGLGAGWVCTFSNDIDPKKIASYKSNWGDDVISEADIADIHVDSIPMADMAWASFPCQDLSQAGAGAGLKGERSGTFWPFWDKIRALRSRGLGPKIVALENVQGAITSHEGKDFAAICEAVALEGYTVGALLIDAAHFVPQSRVRLFIVGVSAEVSIPEHLVTLEPDRRWHSKSLIAAAKSLPPKARQSWVWWTLPTPPTRSERLTDCIDVDANASGWHSRDYTQRMLDMMTALNREKVTSAKRSQVRTVGAIYKRRRSESDGATRQRAEVRFDNVAGCIRTPTGGSSRQTILIVDGDDVRSRFLQPREAARLMGLPDDYLLPENYYDAYHLVGDGVAIPVVRYIAQHLVEPLIASAKRAEAT